jgi:DNA-directed RNA polymerase beta' subunit
MDTSTYSHDEDIRPIDRIEFSILGNDEIIKISAFGKDSMGIEIPDLYDNLEPKRGGLIDTRLGPSDNHLNCGTCGLDVKNCNGHFGHITLADYVYHMGYLNFVKKILSCICLKCSKLLVNKNEAELLEILKHKSGRSRFNEVKNIAKNVTYCQKLGYGCGIPVSKIKIDIKKSTCAINIISETNFTTQLEEGETSTDTRKKIRQIISPEDCYNILSNISDIDCMILGFDPKKSRPEMMIHKIFPVPPVQVRPSIKADFLASASSEDDLTHKLADIIKANIRTRRYKDNLNESSAKYAQDHTHLLQYHVATYYDNDSCTIPRAEQRGKPIKSLTARLNGKEGRIRLNLMGKRVDFSARTVITSDPTIDINQLRIPKLVAMNLTFPEVVTPYNIERLQKLVNNGRNVYPGANFVFPHVGLNTHKKVLPIDLRFKKVVIDFGDVVERHLIDDDFVLLNRQPTLHKLSMMAHRIKVIMNDKLSTFGLSPAVTTPYNADFDGDEMNIFVPQSIQTMMELREIADVMRQIISPRFSTPIIGIVQDGILGSYNMTAPTMSIEWKDAMNIIAYTSIDDFSAIKKNKNISGSDMFSLIIPGRINVKTNDFHVEDGHITKGQVSKTYIGAKKQNSLIHLIWDEYGPVETKNFIDDVQKLINNFNLWNGFTVGIGDLEIPNEVTTELTNFFETKKLEVKHMITEMENNPDFIDQDIFEDTLYNNLNNIREEASKMVMKNLKHDNNFYIMIFSGAKGEPINMGQILGCIGQQAVEGTRIKKNVNGRSLHYFHKDDDTALARGFVEQSFLKGMKPQSFIFHNMGSREGLIDTAIKSVTGDTPIFVLDNETIKYVNIGDWIDKQLDDSDNKSKIKHYKDRDIELLDLTHNVYIPTTNEFGIVTWSIISAITRHDPGDELFEIKTKGGRKVIVTESKSLLIWVDGKFVRMSTPDVKIGDFVPVTQKLCNPPFVHDYIDTYANMQLLFPKTEKFELNYINGIFIGLFLAKGLSNETNNYVQLSNIDNNTLNFMKKWFDSFDIKYTNDINNDINSITGYSDVLAKFITYLHNNNFLLTHLINANDDFIKGLLNGYISGNGYITNKSIKILSNSKELIDGLNILLNRLNIFGKININHINEYNIIPINILSIKGQWINMFIEKITLIDNYKNSKLAEIKIDKIYTNFKPQNDVVLDEITEINIIDITKYPKVYDLTVPDTLNFGLANGLHVVDTAESGYMQRKLIKSMEDAMIKYDLTVRNANNTILQFIYGDSGVDTTKQYEYVSKILEIGNTELYNRYKFTEDELKSYKDFNKKQNDDYINELITMRDNIRDVSIKTGLNRIVLNKKFMLPVNFVRIINNNTKPSGNTKLSPNYIIQKINDIISSTNTFLMCMNKRDLQNTKSLKNIDEQIAKTMFKFALHEKLAPKQCMNHNFTKEQFDKICNDIITSYNDHIVSAGEMIGTIAAQSLGEPLTQMTLNSVDWEEEIIISNNGFFKVVKIGDFTDKLIDENFDKVEHVGDITDKEMGDTYYLDIKDKNIQAISVNENGFVSWNLIEAVTKHLPMNIDGTDDLVKITTNMGRTATATKAKSFLTKLDNKIIPIRGDELKIGTELPLITEIPKNGFNILHELYLEDIKYNIPLDKDLGFFIGAFLANGHLSESQVIINNNDNDYRKKIIMFCIKHNIKHHTIDNTDIITCTVPIIEILKQLCETNSNHKYIQNWVYNANKIFLKELINGYFSSNSNIEFECITSHSISEKLIDGVMRILLIFGIISKKNIDNCAMSQQLYKLSINDIYVTKFANMFTLVTKSKMQELNKITNNLVVIDNSTIYHDKIKSIEIIKPTHKYVYDLSVKHDRTFVLGGGMLVNDTFHSAGIGGMGTTTLGVPRIKELFSFSKNMKTPSMTIYVEDELRKNKYIVERIASSIEKITIGNIRDTVDVYYDPNPFAKDGFMEKDNVTNVFHHAVQSKYACQSDISGLPWLMRIVLNKEKMMEKDIVLLDIKSKFCNYWEKRYTDIKGIKKEDRQLFEKISQCAILSNNDNDIVPILHLRFDMKDFNYKTITSLLDNIIDGFKLKGVQNIDKINALVEERLTLYDKDNAEKIDSQYVIYTAGINMTALRYINGIDLNKSKCNDVVMVYEKYGIEAARMALLKECDAVYGSSANFVNYQHISVLVDIMTNNGTLTTIDRHGLNKIETDPLARSSFEKTVDHFLQAAVYGEVDYMRSVSSRIMAGLAIKGGTGLCDVLLDTEMLEKSEYTEDVDSKYNKTFNKLNSNPVMNDILSKTPVDIFMPDV